MDAIDAEEEEEEKSKEREEGEEMTTDIIVPTIREKSIEKFHKAWGFENLIVVWDNQDTYDIIERNFGKDAWIFSRKNAAIRCYGYLQSEADVILTLDDDCYPNPNWDYEFFIDTHKRNLTLERLETAWHYTGVGRMRGLPYQNLERQPEIMLSHGLWTENADFDAITEISGNTNFEPYEMIVPRGQYFAMCSMNLAFKKEIKPLMFMPMMGEEWPFDRWDDIWCGVLAKKVLDHLGLGVWSGSPFVSHSKKSDKWVNLMKESKGNGYKVNEILWERVDEVVLTKDSIKGAYVELAEKFNMRGEYWEKLKEAMVIWANLC